jgi:hypothetical protein
MKRGPKKISFNGGKKKRKNKKKSEKISTTAKTTAGGYQTSCTSTIWMHTPAPEIRICEEKQQASARFRNPRRKKASVSETLERQASPNFIYFYF